jgi:uncharacterized protein
MNDRTAKILAAALVLASLVLGWSIYSTRKTQDTVRVVGMASQPFTADIVKWTVSYQARTSLDDLAQGYAKINTLNENFRTVWNSLDIKADDPTFQPVAIDKQYAEYGKIVGNTLNQRIVIISHDLDAIEKLAVNPAPFIGKNIAFETSSLEYYSEKLPDLKKQLLAAAAKDARDRSDELVKGSGRKIGKLVSARAGVFQITEPYSNDVSDYGINSNSSRKKDIRVTVNAEFSVR